uniref:Nucleoside phosphorylase domain-containing protein n=1 Tax=Colobus angolensis palliatus TaxID=336983 RepID=A0A2K5IM44_COLAP
MLAPGCELDPDQEVVRTRPEDYFLRPPSHAPCTACGTVMTVHIVERMASVIPASNSSMRSDRNTYVGKRFVHVKNPYLDSMDEDILYHLYLGTKTHNLPAMFGDVKFVCVGGSPNRMKAFALFMHKELGLEEAEEDIKDICAGTDRYCMYKTGPVTAWAPPPFLLCFMNSSNYHPRFEQVILDNIVTRSTELHKELSEELFNCSKEIPTFRTLIGHTMCTYDFYEGQGRLDGALCSFSTEKKLDYLKRAYKAGVRNIEMESTVSAAMCGLCGLTAAVVCVTLLDRLHCDQINLPHDVLVEYQQRPQLLISNFIRRRLGLCD